jgi:phytoene synthase
MSIPAAPARTAQLGVANQPDTAVARARSALGDTGSIGRRARQENFTVASRLLPAGLRQRLMAVYGYARLVDQAGDAAFGDRDRLLDAIEADLDALFAGTEPVDPVIARLHPTVTEFAIPREPFQALLEANRRDQRQTRYETFDDLLGYCELSANPVGELVLRILGALTPATRAHSDRICSGLQVVEHLQDIAEDYQTGRIYLPQEDLRRFGVLEFELEGPGTSDALRQVVALEASRARALLHQGLPLLGALTGPARFAVAAYVAGGLVAVRAMERAGYDVVGRCPKPPAAERMQESLRLMALAQHPATLARQPEPLGAGVLREPPTAAVVAAYDQCLAITRVQARNFYFGIRLLPPERRRALAAVYALARRIDDIGESAIPPAEKLDKLETLREAVLTGRPDHPVLVALADAATRFPIPIAAFGELIDGVIMDVCPAPYQTYADLLVYCRRVAGSVGRLSLGMFETTDRARAAVLADDLGIALQMTNILRDVIEDLGRGRVYLPLDDLAAAGVGPRLEGPPQLLAGVIATEAERAEAWYGSGLLLLDLLDSASRACVETMATIYHELLRRIAADPLAALSKRVSLPAWRKGGLAVRAAGGGLLGLRPRVMP